MGLFAGGFVATTGMLKDIRWEPFSLKKYVRSPIIALIWCIIGFYAFEVNDLFIILGYSAGRLGVGLRTRAASTSRFSYRLSFNFFNSSRIASNSSIWYCLYITVLFFDMYIPPTRRNLDRYHADLVGEVLPPFRVAR